MILKKSNFAKSKRNKASSEQRVLMCLLRLDLSRAIKRISLLSFQFFYVGGGRYNKVIEMKLVRGSVRSSVRGSAISA